MSALLRRIVAFVAVLMTIVLATSACQGAASPSVASPASLMDQLARDGDLGLFEARYVGALAEDALIFVGTKDGNAVGYLCHPTAGSRWFTGTSAGGRIDLHDAKGGHLVGPVTAGAIEGTLSGSGALDGTVTLRAAGIEARLVREREVRAGQLVGGLVFDGAVIRGVITVNASALIKSSVLPSPGLSSIAIGIRSTIGPRIDLTIATNPKLTSAQQTAASREIFGVRDKLERERAAAAVTFYLAVTVAVITCTIATVSTAAVSASAVSAAQTGRLVDLDASANGFLTNALNGIVEGLQVSAGTQPPRSSATPPPVTLGTVSFGSFSGGL